MGQDKGIIRFEARGLKPALTIGLKPMLTIGLKPALILIDSQGMLHHQDVSGSINDI